MGGTTQLQTAGSRGPTLKTQAVVWGNRVYHSKHSLRGEVLRPATELAMKKSAICLRASRPVGLFPLFICSWIRPSNSSLKAWSRDRERDSARERERDTGRDRETERLNYSRFKHTNTHPHILTFICPL